MDNIVHRSKERLSEI